MPDSVHTLVKDAWEATVRARKQGGTPQRRSYVYAPGWSPCGKRMCLDLLHPEEREEYNDDKGSRWGRGPRACS